jgi:hypothetical protein
MMGRHTASKLNVSRLRSTEPGRASRDSSLPSRPRPLPMEVEVVTHKSGDHSLFVGAHHANRDPDYLIAKERDRFRGHRRVI